MKRFLSIIIVCSLLISVFAGCNKTPESEDTGSTETTGITETDAASTDDATADEQVLKYGTDTWPAGFDPHTISAVAALRVFSQVYETLVEYDEDMSIIGRLAESWETQDDVTYIFYLREGVLFHNGQEMTAEDVKYSFDRILGNTDDGDIGALGSSDSYYGGIESIEVIDDYTVQFNLTSTNAAFLSSLTNWYGSIVCQEEVDANDGSLATIESMCGTGPFKYSDSIVDNTITLVKNEDYYIEGKPVLDGITFYLISDESARLAALRTGEINLCSMSALNLSDVEGDSSLQVISYQTNNYTYVGFNLSNEKLQDESVRQAMSMALDRESIIDYVYDGAATVSTFVPSSMGNWFWDAESKSPLYSYDVEAAKALMEEAGYSEDNRLSISMAAGLLDAIRDTAVIIQQQLKEIYIDVEITNLESGEYVDVWGIMDTADAGYDTMVGQNGAGVDPSRAVGFFYSTSGSANVWGYSNERVDELCGLGLSTLDEDERASYYLEAQELIVEESPNLWIASPIEYFFASSSVQGYSPFVGNINNLRNASV